MRSCRQEMSNQGPRVRFSEMSEMVLITNLSEGPDKHKIWYTRDELDLFKANMFGYIKMVRLHISKSHAPAASKILGMEKFLTVQLTEEYKFRRGKLRKEVLNEARWQRAAARGNPPSDKLVDLLAKIAAEHSKWARERARAAALFLEQDQETEGSQDLQQQSITYRQVDSQFNAWRRSASLQETKQSPMTPSSFEADLASMENGSHPRFRMTVS
eukprot:CAMPEP_0202006186 /NCGR_PEP_ID=MMETSP0905-20130828/11019_1 /ASSEMBLY_ACC=CAM_ASM_000554 /TAXON_ID=420261 /ORGANISM="Thalassiosira antarctica, Strain CCMP982" /LENGTH=214 /DNA_ID=CAMNT_0048563903 /DNA_START=52 /DNA_END=692 /DNA_ORIENTATION=+